MDALTRRSLLGGSLALLTSSHLPLSARSPVDAQIEFPRGPMILSRQIVRMLSDGKRVVVSRSWEITFLPRGEGAMVMGRQISAKVDAPSGLEPIVQIEEQRSTDGMFPILLSPAGRVIASGRLNNEQDIAKAVSIAQDIVEHSSRTEDEKAALLRHLPTLQAAGTAQPEALPPDLFFPEAGDSSETRKVALPNGQTGEIELLRSSRLADGERWLKRIEQKIITRVQGSSRESLDIWSLQPPPVPVESSQ